MTLPPALTWMSLLPQDASYVCQSGSTWLRDAVATHGGAGRPQMLVTYQQAAAQLPNLESYGGLVAINGRDLSDVSLQQQGFQYVRRFAILPSLDHPRWFIPLDNAAVSSAAFGLYKPVRWPARLKHFGARVSAGAGFHFWYRDHVCIAQRELPPLETALQDVFAGSCRWGVRFAFSSGNVETVRNRKPVLAVLDLRGRTLGYGKLSISPLSHRRVVHEAKILSALARPGRDVIAPRLLFAGEVDGASLTVTSPLVGRVAGPHLSAAHRDFLRALRGGETKPVGHTALIRSLRDGAGSATHAGRDLLAVLDRVLPLLERVELPAAVVHRDFAPWNLRQHNGAIAAFDWEYAELDGPPLLDEYHHQLAVAYFLDHCTAEQGCQRLLRASAPAPLGLSSEQVRALQVVYLVDHLTGLLDEGYAIDYPKFDWWWQVLIRLVATLPREDKPPSCGGPRNVPRPTSTQRSVTATSTTVAQKGQTP